MDNLVNTKESIKTRGQLEDLVCRNGLLDDVSPKEIRKMTIAQLQKVWDEGIIEDGGR